MVFDNGTRYLLLWRHPAISWTQNIKCVKHKQQKGLYNIIRADVNGRHLMVTIGIAGRVWNCIY